MWGGLGMVPRRVHALPGVVVEAGVGVTTQVSCILGQCHRTAMDRTCREAQVEWQCRLYRSAQAVDVALYRL
jgi:hypothetical protein